MSGVRSSEGDPTLGRSSDDTVAALLTPPGTGAIGVVRVYGRRARQIVDECCRRGSASNAAATYSSNHHRREARASVERVAGDDLSLRTLFDEGEALDDVVVSAVPNAPVPTIDLCAHGGTRVLERVLNLLRHHGARIADLNGRPFDAFGSGSLIEREANEAVQLAKTETAAMFFARQRVLLPRTLAEIVRMAREEPATAREMMKRMCCAWPSVRLLLHGATVALVGPPNVGKSTLFNALAGRTVALTSPIAGTTRDWVTTDVEFDGVPITLIDTAGDRVTEHPLEVAAIRAGRSKSASADLRVLLREARGEVGADGNDPACTDPRQACREWRAAFLVETKTDRCRDRCPESASATQRENANRTTGEANRIRVSAIDGSGLSDLRQGVLAALGWNVDCLRKPALVSERQARIVAAAVDSTDNMLYHTIMALDGNVAETGPR